MKLRSSAVVVCVLLGLIYPLHSQQARKANTQNITVGTGKDHVVDLCALAATLTADSAPNKRVAGSVTISGHKTIQLETLHTPRKQYRLIEHDEPKVSYPNQEQIVWTCLDKNFQITSIQKIGEPDKPGSSGNSDAMEFPFDPKKSPGLYAPQKAGTKWPSGPPVCQAVGQWYKYSFIIGGSIKKNPDGTQSLIDGDSFDPHFIVTGGTDPTYRLLPCPRPNPTPAKTPTKSKH